MFENVLLYIENNLFCNIFCVLSGPSQHRRKKETLQEMSCFFCGSSRFEKLTTNIYISDPRNLKSKNLFMKSCARVKVEALPEMIFTGFVS